MGGGGMGGGGMGGGGMGGGGIGGGAIGGGAIGGGGSGVVRVDALELVSVDRVEFSDKAGDGDGDGDGDGEDQHSLTSSTTKLSPICSFSLNNVRTCRLASIRSLRTILSVSPNSSPSNTFSTTMMSGCCRMGKGGKSV